MTLEVQSEFMSNFAKNSGKNKAIIWITRRNLKDAMEAFLKDDKHMLKFYLGLALKQLGEEGSEDE